ncbi:hypothetical protein ACFX19_038772 [Malus domestica]
MQRSCFYCFKSFHVNSQDEGINRTTQFAVLNHRASFGSDFTLSEVQEELSFEKDLSFNIRLQLQKTQESNSDLILAVRDLEEILGHKNNEIANLSNRPESCGDAAGLKATISKGGTSEDEEQLELILLRSTAMPRKHTCSRNRSLNSMVKWKSLGESRETKMSSRCKWSSLHLTVRY